jgi:hypothetical protein
MKTMVFFLEGPIDRNDHRMGGSRVLVCTVAMPLAVIGIEL